MVDRASLGRARAEVVTASLKELNDAVGGNYVVEHPSQLIASNPTFFHEYDLIIGAQLRSSDAAALDAICREKATPLILIRSYGLLGSVRVCVAEHCVVDSKPDNSVEDLRLAEPWPELSVAGAQVDGMMADDHGRGHVPYALLLVRAAAAWRASHASPLPSTYADKTAFKESLNAWKRYIEGVPLEEENIMEAISNAHRVWSGSCTPVGELRQMFQDEACQQLHTGSKPFWVCVAALARFVAAEGAGAIPLEGSIPDMHAGSQEYLNLQRLYRTKADSDAAAVEQHVHALLEDLGRPACSIPSSYIRAVCKNVRRLRVVRCPAVTAGLPPGVGAGVREGDAPLRQALASEDSTAATAAFAVLVSAADRFYKTSQRFPGASLSSSYESEEDAIQLHSVAHALLAEAGLPGVSLPEDAVAEVVRWGGAELHCMAAVVGSIGSQEAIKLLTGQFVPVAGALYYSAVHATSLLLA